MKSYMYNMQMIHQTQGMVNRRLKDAGGCTKSSNILGLAPQDLKASREEVKTYRMKRCNVCSKPGDKKCARVSSVEKISKVYL